MIFVINRLKIDNKMDEALKLIEESYQKRILDKETKKKFKNILNNNKLKPEDLNFLSKKSFYLFKQNHEADIFLIDWLEDIQNLINRYRITESKESQVCFSPKNECSDKICKFISKAEQSLLICVFTISDNQITDSILNAHKRGVMIKIITDNDKSMDKGSDIYQMSKQGINIKIDMTRHHMHHKFAIRDNKSLLTGSYNWTRSAEIYNQENFIITNEKKLVKRFRKEFDKLWQEMADYK